MQPLCIPSSLTQGEYFTLDYSNSDYPNSTWDSYFVFFGARHILTVDATKVSSDFRLTITTTQTTAMVPGTYGWQCWVSNADDSQKYIIDSGTIEIKQDASTQTLPGIDPRSTSKKMYDDISGMLTNPAFVKGLSPEQLSSLSELHKRLEWDVKRETDAEKIKRGGYVSRKIFTRFV